MVLSGPQIRAGRALLGWHRRDLAAIANRHPNSIAYWEQREEIPWPQPIAVRHVLRALQAHGITMVSDPGPGVALLPKRAMPLVRDRHRNEEFDRRLDALDEVP